MSRCGFRREAPYRIISQLTVEFYHVISGSGVVRYKDGTTPIEAGDASFSSRVSHTRSPMTRRRHDPLRRGDNPIGDTYYQPDSNKWGVPIPERRIVRSDALDYFDGEE